MPLHVNSGMDILDHVKFGAEASLLWNVVMVFGLDALGNWTDQ